VPGGITGPTCHSKRNSVALVHKRTIPTERPPHVGEVSANFLRIEGQEHKYKDLVHQVVGLMQV
jgi:hypothetical protein